MMTETDRELLQFAAKAAGEWPSPEPFEHILSRWNPLTDDGDAFRLSVKLNITVRRSDEYDASYAVAPYDPTLISETDADPYAATRRAIVRAAAEIGRTMK
jgi:hypothetical protein